jgi:hypothetical protein
MLTLVKGDNVGLTRMACIFCEYVAKGAYVDACIDTLVQHNEMMHSILPRVKK